MARGKILPVEFSSQKNVLKGQETGQINHLAKLGKVINTFLDFLKTVAHSVALEGDLEKRVAHRALEQEIISHSTRSLGQMDRDNDQRINCSGKGPQTTVDVVDFGRTFKKADGQK